MGSVIRTIWIVVGIGAALLLTECSGLSQDWPQWRGPNRDGVVHGVAVPAKWPKTLKEEWEVRSAEESRPRCWSAAAFYVFSRMNDDEFVLCLDLASGKEIWRTELCPAPYEKLGLGEDQGTAEQRPRSTPAVVAGGFTP